MSDTGAIFVVIGFVLLACSVGLAQEGEYYESFEDGVPAYFEATRPDSLTISPRHSKQGGNSLRWDWQNGEELVIRHDIGDVNRTGGYRCRAAFSVWLYMEKPVSDAVVFEFREGQDVTGSFSFPLEFTGWRQGRPLYSNFPTGRPSSDVDNIRITAPTETVEGTLFVDFIKYNTLTYGSGAVIPERVARWQRPVPDEERFPKPKQVTEAELAGIRSLLGPDMGPGIDEARVNELCEAVDALGIVRDEDGVRGGPGIDAHYQYLAAAGEQGLKDVRYWPDEHGPNWLGMQTPGPMSSLANRVAKAYRASNDPDQRSRLAEAFLLIADHLHDQALQAASGFRWHWWVGGAWADAVFLMRDVLADAGRLQPHLDFLLYTYGGGVLFEENDPTSHMDFYNLTCPRLLHLCLLQVEPAEQVRWLRAFRDMLQRSMLQPTGALKVDGSAYHHAGHYHSYARGAFMHLAELLEALKPTPWRLSAKAHERLRRAVLAQRIYANWRDLPLALKGRSPFAPGYGVLAGAGLKAMDILARCGTPDGTQDIDREVAAAYLRLVPEAADDEPYSSLGIQPEPEPNGTFVMPYAGLLCHRRDKWLASIKGQSKYVWGSERQAQRNCYGLFQGLGNLEILAGGDPVTAEASGRVQAGWDWRRFEGTTVPQLPLEAIDKGWPSSRPRSAETFVGGVSYQNRQGIFAMILNQPMPRGHTLTGRKSWFFDDDRILCLGSNISCDEPEHPTQTTLCQKALRAHDDGEYPSTPLDGEKVTAFPEEITLDPAETHWFIDIQQTGYYVPGGHNATVIRGRQVSRDFLDREDTEGDFLTAWIDHGRAPENAAYEYMMVIRATPDRMQKLAAEVPYQIVQCDEDAHIVWHTEPRRWSCVFFVPQDVNAHSVSSVTIPVLSVDRPCLIVSEETDDGRMAMSVADPDLNLQDGAGQPRSLRLTLRGAWGLLDAKETVCEWPLDDTGDSVRILSANDGETVLEIICQHGASYDITLQRTP
ncbi:MAG: chondroitinase family polysaccharide lyase [Armatimonadota bacterium]